MEAPESKAADFADAKELIAAYFSEEAISKERRGSIRVAVTPRYAANIEFGFNARGWTSEIINRVSDVVIFQEPRLGTVHPPISLLRQVDRQIAEMHKQAASRNREDADACWNRIDESRDAFDEDSIGLAKKEDQ
jgi:hypothetical protein